MRARTSAKAGGVSTFPPCRGHGGRRTPTSAHAGVRTSAGSWMTGPAPCSDTPASRRAQPRQRGVACGNMAALGLFVSSPLRGGRQRGKRGKAGIGKALHCRLPGRDRAARVSARAIDGAHREDPGSAAKSEAAGRNGPRMPGRPAHGWRFPGSDHHGVALVGDPGIEPGMGLPGGFTVRCRTLQRVAQWYPRYAGRPGGSRGHLR